MAHGSQQRGLHHVRAPQRLGLERLAGEALAVDRDTEERRQRRKETPAGGSRSASQPFQADRADAPPSGGQRVSVRRVVAEGDLGMLDLKRLRSFC